MGEQLQIRIYPNGKIAARTRGVKGKKCDDYVKVLEQLLEAKAREVVHTEEYRQQEILEEVQAHITSEERER